MDYLINGDHLKGDGQCPIDFSTLEELLHYPAMMSTALLAGYPACCLMFTRSWNSFSSYKKGVFSASMGGGYTVIGWIFLVYVRSVRSEYSNLISGNEVILTTALLFLIAMAEVILIAILRFVRLVRLRRRKKAS